MSIINTQYGPTQYTSLDTTYPTAYTAGELAIAAKLDRLIGLIERLIVVTESRPLDTGDSPSVL